MSVFIGYPSFMAYQMMKGKKGNNDDDFPSISGIIARYSALGLTNEQMAANPVWVDKTGNGHDLQMKNFAWGGMSGIGGYSDNFSSDSWKKPSDRSDITWTSSSFNITRVMNTGVQIYYFSTWEESESVIPEKRIIVKGLEDGQVLRYMNVGNRIIEISQDGIYTIPSFTFKGANSYHGYSLAKKQESCNVTVEQLPLYPGFILGDGVDDFAVTENNLDLEDTYTIYTPLILLKYGGVVCGKNSDKDFSLNTVISSKSIGFDSANAWVQLPVDLYKFVLVVCKRNSKTMYVKDLITGKSNQSNSKELVSNPGKYFIWRNTGGSWSKVAIAGQVICNGYFSTDEDDEKVLNYYKQEYPWLFFCQAWTVVGKTNKDTDRATIANITGNGNDLVLSNFGFAENSGYGLYYQYFGNGFKTTNGEIIGGSWDKINNYNISCNIRMPINAIGKCFWDSSVLTTGIKLRFKLTGMAEGDVLAFGYTNVYDLTYTSDGIYIIELPPTDKSCGFSLQSSLTENLPTTPVTIELLPFDYEGYLVTDGVDDKIQSSNFSMGKDFTVVGEWKMLKNSDTYELAGINKYDSFTLYNYSYNNRINVYIHSGQGTPINTDSIKAFTSTGLIYIDNFNNVEEVIPRDKTDRGYTLFIGYNNNVFTKLAFKNLAIYSEVLSKEDCIKAYNFLQTLKAK